MEIKMLMGKWVMASMVLIETFIRYVTDGDPLLCIPRRAFNREAYGIFDLFLSAASSPVCCCEK